MGRVSRNLLLLGVPLILLSLGYLAHLSPGHVPKSSRSKESGDAAGLARRVRLENLARTPLSFIENRGQLDPRVRYYLLGRDTAVYFTRDGITFALTGTQARETTTKGTLKRASRSRVGDEREPRERWTLKLDFVGANPNARLSGEERTSAVVSYFKGPRQEWKTGLATYRRLVYHDLWPGIDLVYSGTFDRLKYSFRVRPGADPGRIRLAYRGATRIGVDRDGRLEVHTPMSGLGDATPYSYQETGARRVEVKTSYALDSIGSQERLEYGFDIGPYDKSRVLVLDPAILVYAGYVGGVNADSGLAIAVDSAGAAYIAGETLSVQPTFPVTVGPDLTFNDTVNTDAFVAKVEPDGSGLVYAGYIGGSAADSGTGIAVDGSGNAYVTGWTLSTETAGFPVALGPDTTHNLGVDAFIVKVNSVGTGLDYAGYIGGSGTDRAFDVEVDSSGNAYVTGDTSSDQNSFPVMAGPFTVHRGGFDAFVAKVKSDGTGLDYAGYIGGASDDQGLGIAVDNSGNAYVTGHTGSSSGTFPVTVGPDTSYNGGSEDAFVAKVRPDGTGLVYAGYLGGSGTDGGNAIAIDSAGNAYVAGSTNSNQSNFPDTVGPDVTYNGGGDAFVARVKSDGTALDYAGYIGGIGDDQGLGIAVDGSGNAYVTGFTSSDATTFPVIEGPDLIYNLNGDAFVARVKSDGTALDYAGYIGGASSDKGRGVAVDGAGDAYVTGITSSAETSFPVAVGPDLILNLGLPGFDDAFVAKVAGPPVTPTPTFTPAPPTNTPTDTPTATPTSTVTNTPTQTPTNTPTTTPTNTPTATPTNTPTPVPPTNTPTNTPTPVPPTNTPTSTPTQTPTPVPPTNTPTQTPTSVPPTNTPTNTPTQTPTTVPPTNTPTNTPTQTPTTVPPTNTPTNTPTQTPTTVPPTNTPTTTPTNTLTATPTNTPTPVPPTNTPTNTPTQTPTTVPPTNTPTTTPTNTLTATPTNTPTPVPPTDTPTNTPTQTPTTVPPTNTPTTTPTNTLTATPTNTPTPVPPTNTPTNTPTATPTVTPTPTPMATSTPTPTLTPTSTPTNTPTSTPSPTATNTPTPTITSTVLPPTHTPTRTPTVAGPTPTPGPAICRGAGFWATHADTDSRKACSQNITAAVIRQGGGAIEICGETLTAEATTDDEATALVESVDNASSALEALCVKIEGEQRLQLARQLTAMALNCIVSGLGADCGGSATLGDLFDFCNSACLADSASVASCIDRVDCFNGGGLFDGHRCIDEPNGCEQRDLPEFALTGNTTSCPDPGPAGSSDECKAARKTSCTILPPGQAACARQ
jgi:hypothetical protein